MIILLILITLSLVLYWYSREEIDFGHISTSQAPSYRPIYLWTKKYIWLQDLSSSKLTMFWSLITNILKTSKCKMYFDRVISLLVYKPLRLQACLKPLTKTYKLTAYKQQFGVLF